ncbi:MAG: formylglycine-generating enzyme family protein [Armatimonadetes bacterium]|nr:formylglycine-generating enzyme family protein [Armatimonadota bacterium]
MTRTKTTFFHISRGIALCGLAFSACISQGQTKFAVTLKGHLASLTMVQLPNKLFFSETEVPFELFDIWAMDLDNPTGEALKGKDAIARPSKPYGVIYSGFGHNGFPAMCVSYYAATKFCVWLSEQTGKKFRLPTEKEWGVAASAGQPAPRDLEKVAWFWDNADDVTHPVGKLQANAWGLKDMLGNVAEWVKGTDGKPYAMGGSWKTKLEDLSFGTKQAPSPSWNEADPQDPKSIWWLANGQFIGFRIVCEGKTTGK